MQIDKLRVIEEIYKACYGNVNFLDVGSDLAYVTQAIITDMKCELNPLGKLVLLLKEKFPLHSVWKYIYVEPTVLCINCEAEILWDQASFCSALEGWLGHNCCVDASDEDGYYEEVVIT